MRRLALGLLVCTAALAAEPRPRARDLGITPGVFPAGPLDAITDVAGVRVGHSTLVEGDRVRTGVTAILPHGGNLFQPLFQAALEATEEAVYNSLLQATTVTSRSGTVEAIPIDRVRAILKKYGR